MQSICQFDWKICGSPAWCQAVAVKSPNDSSKRMTSRRSLMDSGGDATPKGTGRARRREAGRRTEHKWSMAGGIVGLAMIAAFTDERPDPLQVIAVERPDAAGAIDGCSEFGEFNLLVAGQRAEIKACQQHVAGPRLVRRANPHVTRAILIEQSHLLRLIEK